MSGRFNRDIHNRRSIRLQNYDYSSAGAYFVTICVQHRESIFGNVINGDMVLNDAGLMVQKVWEDLPFKCPGIEIDKFIIMSNHVHGIIFIVGAPLVGALCNGANPSNKRAGTRPAPTLGDVVGIFKSIATHQYVINVNRNNWNPFPGKLWQRNYHEHVIRNEKELFAIRKYIQDNPLNWVNDTDNPDNF